MTEGTKHERKVMASRALKHDVSHLGHKSSMG